MKEFKLIPLNETNISATEPHSKVSQLKNMVETQKVDGNNFNDLITNLLMNEKTDEHFKIILLNYLSQKIDNKTNENFSEKISKEENKSVINSNIFDIIKSSIFAADIPNTYRIFTYFTNKNDIEWDENGNITISGSKIGMDIYKLIKYLSTRNMKINVEDRENLKRLLYTAHPIKKYIKNSHIIRLMDADNDVEYEDLMPILNRTNSIRPRIPRVMPKRKSKQSGAGIWLSW